MVPIQSILLIPLKGKLGFGMQASVWNPFLDKQLALGQREKSVMECILSKSLGW